MDKLNSKQLTYVELESCFKAIKKALGDYDGKIASELCDMGLEIIEHSRFPFTNPEIDTMLSEWLKDGFER